ncbi:MAG: bifunctional nuclease domain-containing protein [Bacteroidota bacterium]|nr:bifunctional nuclease domain-containing protein [Bacteroidota bacterium]
MNFVQLDIAAIKQSDSQNNAYVLLLNETTGKRQLPIVIGWCEARSIAIALDGTEEPERPLTHDLFKTMGDKFNINIQKIVIHTLIEGIFHSSFYCKHQHTDEEIAIDARTSDAIAIAIRYKCPIFTYEDILSRAGIIINSSNKNVEDTEKLNRKKEDDSMSHPTEINSFSVEQLNKLLAKAIEDEDYEKASEIRDELKNRKGK